MKNSLTKSFALLTLFAAALTSCNDQSVVPQIEYVPVQETEDGKWGFVGPDGKMLVSDEFEKTPSPVIEGRFSVEEGEKSLYSVYEASAKPKIVGDLEGLKYVGVYRDGLLPIVRPKERISIVDENGKTVATLEPYKNKEIMGCVSRYTEGMLAVQIESGEWGFVDDKGEMKIEPRYEDIRCSYTGGYAVVNLKQKSNDKEKEDVIITQLIDKKGEVKFKLKDTQEFMSFDGKYIVVENSDRVEILDLKGERVLKCPEKVEAISDVQDGLFLFKSTEGIGLMTLEGEQLLRPKYEEVYQMKDKFIAVKDNDKGVDIINRKGDIVKSLDYEGAYYVEGFGMLVQDGKEYYVANEDGEPLDKKNFFRNLSLNSGYTYYLENDYFDAKALAVTLYETLKGEDFKDLKLGMEASKIARITEKPASEWKYSSSESFNIKIMPKYSINGFMNFTESIGESYYTTAYDSYYGYTYSYQKYAGDRYNPASKLGAYGETVNLSVPEAKAVTTELINVIKNSGRKVLKSGKSGSILEYGAGQEVVVGATGENSLIVAVYESKYRDSMGSFIDNGDIDVNEVTDEVVEVEADSVAVEAEEYIPDSAK